MKLTNRFCSRFNVVCDFFNIHRKYLSLSIFKNYSIFEGFMFIFQFKKYSKNKNNLTQTFL